MFLTNNFLPKAYSQETYPQLDISGYKKYEYNYLNVDKMTHLFQAQTMLGGYYAAGPWQERLKLRIVGQLNEKLSVSYDLEQQQDMPDRYNVKVTYDKTDLTFGDFNATFGGNEFASTTKFLNGVMITSKDQWYNLTFVPSSKLKSYTQFLATQRGNNSRGPYNIGHNSIIEGTELVELNNIKLIRGIDYVINYFEGTIMFARILSSEDEFKYIYEYTNIIDLFFPTISKRDFMGLRVDTMFDPTSIGTTQPKPTQSIKRTTEYFPTILKIEGTVRHEKAVPLIVSSKRSTEETLPSTDILVGNMAIIKIHDSTLEASAEDWKIIESNIRGLIEGKVGTREIILVTSEGNPVIKARDKTIINVRQTEAEIQGVSSEALAKKWFDNIIIVLGITLEIETLYPTLEQEIPEEFEWESTGIYKLNKYPVFPYSETLYFKGRELKKFEDYIIDYNTGTVTFFSPTLPTPLDPLSIDYGYIDIATEAEILPGAGFGQYYLSHEHLVVGSETILVNNIPYVRDLDYVIDYEKGTILFASSISQTSNIQVKYSHIVLVTPPPPVNPPVPQTISIGGTYLKESGKGGSAQPTSTIQETFSGSNIISNNNTIYLSLRPLTSTNEVTVYRNGVVLTYEAYYLIPTIDASTGAVIPPTKLAYINDRSDRSDGLYTGTIKYLGTIEASDTISVTYTYKKWSQERYTGSGTSGTRTYYLGILRDIVPGTEIVQIWRKGMANPIIKTLSRNSSLETYDGHYSINYSNPPNITFNNDPMVIDGETFYLNDINFTLIFKFIPAGTMSQLDISHNVYGIDSAFQMGDSFRIAGTLAKSETDQLYNIVSTNETFNGNGTEETFYLNSQGTIIDGSEQVFVNNQKLNKDVQYYFFYGSSSGGKYGTVTFYAIAPSTQDVISIDYKYQDSLGTPVTGVKQGNAYSVSGSIKPINGMNIDAEYKKVEHNYSPLGGTSIPMGSEYKHLYSKLAPLSNFWIAGDYKENNNPIGSYTDKYLNSYDTSISGGFDPYGIAQIDFGFRDYTSVDDLLPPSTTHNNDSKSYAYSLSISPRSLAYGEFSLTNRNDLRKTISFTDTIDNILPKDSIINYAHTNNAFELTKRVRWVFDYQASESTDISYEGGSRITGEVIGFRQSNDLGSNLSWDLTFAPINRLSTYWNRQGHNEYDLINHTNKSTLNETYHADFVPIDQVTSSINHDRQEILTIFTALGNPKTERTSANIRVTPYASTAVGWTVSLDDSIQETGTKTSGWSNAYTINQTPISENIYKITTDYTLTTSSRKAPLGSISSVQTDTRSFTQSYGITVTPLSSLSILGGYIQEDYLNKNDDPVNPINTQSKNETIKAGTSYKFTNELDVSANYSTKLTSIPSSTPKPKVNLDAHAAYKIFTNGTLNYDWSQEDNQGEILSGTFINQNFTKLLHSISVNIVFPQTGETVLSSILIRGSIKWVSFNDHNNPINSFNAHLIALEGSLNF